MAFVTVVHQWLPLLGERGLLPVGDFVRRISFWQSPSLFYLAPKNWAFLLAGWMGVALAILAISGISERFGIWVSMAVWGAMWILQVSFVNVGQTWYSFGWETLLAEAGFLTIFLGDAKTAVPTMVIWLLRWLLFRVMFGAGLIKMRGDACWRDLTCLVYHYETQPMPNPLSWFFHQSPKWIHQAGVVFNHLAELAAPWTLFFRGRIAAIGGLATLGLMGMIFASGNLAYLNFLTLILAIPAFSDQFLGKFLHIAVPQNLVVLPWHNTTTIVLAVLVALLSIRIVINLLSPTQAMNASFEPLHLVNTYGAFGSITRPRYEVVIEGTYETKVRENTRWFEYEFGGKPGNVKKMPPQIAPYHLRLDWLMWFAAFSTPNQHPWLTHLMEKLLLGDKGVLSLMQANPFGDRPPKMVRAILYEYHFTTPEEKKRTGAWWSRTPVRLYYPQVSLDNPQFMDLVHRMGWN